MQNYRCCFAVIILALTGCVQKTYKKTVICNLNVAAVKNIKTVGVRGEGKPLSWGIDLPLKEVVKDSLYTITLPVKTGYKFIELKFTVNESFELENENNRRILFSDGDTTVYNAVFNKMPSPTSSQQ